MLAASFYLKLPANSPLFEKKAFRRREYIFHRDLRTSNGTVKATHRNRLDGVNSLFFETANRLGLSVKNVLDVGISSGITTEEWLREFDARQMQVQMTATDLVVTIYLIRLNSFVSVIVEPNGHFLQFEIFGRGLRAADKRRDSLTGQWMLRRLLTAWAKQKIRSLGIEFPLVVKSKTSPFVTKLNFAVPALQARHDVTLLDHDILSDHLPVAPMAADAIRVANLLQNVYLTPEQIQSAVDNIEKMCHPGTLVVVCRNMEKRIDCSILRYTNEQTFVVEGRIGVGSEVEPYFTHRGSTDSAAPTFPSSPMSVAFFLPNFAGGGAEVATLTLASTMRQRGYDVSLLVANDKGSLRNRLPSDIRLVNFNCDRTWRSLFPLICYLRSERPNFLASALVHNNLIAVWARALAGVKTKVVICQHGMVSHYYDDIGTYRYKFLPFAYWLFARLADAVVNVSDGAADDLAKTAHLPRELITVIYNPIVTDDFPRLAAEPVDHPFYSHSGAPVFVAVGRLIGLKDFPTLINAFSILRKVRDARLVFVGEGPMRAELETLCKKAEIDLDVSFVGFQQNPLPYIRAAAALVVSSKYESFGNVIVEALSVGTPVISTDCPCGPAEILDNGRFGRLVPVGDAQAMADAMKSIIDTAGSEVSHQSRSRAFSVNKITNQYEALFKGL